MIIQSFKLNSNVMYNPQEIANTFNDYFSTVADTPIGNIKKDNDPTINVNPSNYLINILNSIFLRINWKYVTSYETDKIGKSLKAKNSNGYNEIRTKILKLSAPFITSPFTYTCNKSLSSGVLPERLNYATIKPVIIIIISYLFTFHRSLQIWNMSHSLHKHTRLLS